MAEAMIEFQSVTKQYQSGQPAVDELSMSIDQGSITVFVGPSGCGKTTSLRMINRMVEPTSGTITVDGKDVTSVPAAELRRSMGYVMQSSGLMPHRSVLDNIATVPRLNGVSKADARKRAEELLDVVGLASGLGKRYPSQLSGGQQQRVGVARALAADPPVLLMDEPFSAVDPVVRDELQQELLRLQRDLAKTIVFVTHDIDEATVLGDKVAVFAVGGKLAQYATPEEILRAPANEFVASFVGRDRGFRHLAFTTADGVAIHPVPTVTRGGGRGRAPGCGGRLAARGGRRKRGRWAGKAPAPTPSSSRAAPCSGRATPCAAPWTPPCPRRRGWAWPWTVTAGSPASSRRRKCSPSSNPPARSGRAHSDGLVPGEQRHGL